jgi:hypothetical protein
MSKRTIELAAHEKASDHPNAPTPLRRKAARARAKDRLAPVALGGWRDGYLKACEADHVEERRFLYRDRPVPPCSTLHGKSRD